MELKNAVPWGRSFYEYEKMFALSENDLNGRILGCSDGPASFNAELSLRGCDIISADPTYAFSCDQLKNRIDEVYEEVIDQVKNNFDDFIWDTISSVEELGKVRMSAMNLFLGDYEEGKAEGRYVEGSLPELPFEKKQFDLALCSHFLFLYSEQFSYEFHRKSLLQLCSVAEEVRIYPLVNLKNEPSPYVDLFLEEAEKLGICAELCEVSYRFQKGADKMMILKAKQQNP